MSISFHLFQFTHPGRGATPNKRDTKDEQGVSIHAPREGCDRPRPKTCTDIVGFQFTHPGRGATSRDPKFVIDDEFQFTHPGRGATSSAVGTLILISPFQFTHPGRGATLGAVCYITAISSFNSRTPGGVRRTTRTFGEQEVRFQFTPPGRGATEFLLAKTRTSGVSIHAPREGCDSNRDRGKQRGLSFNSRTPGGVRPDFDQKWRASSLFQFTHPGRGATWTLL